jgi:hypothetical protein
MEFCDRGTLRDAVRDGAFHRRAAGGAVGVDFERVIEVPGVGRAAWTSQEGGYSQAAAFLVHSARSKPHSSALWPLSQVLLEVATALQYLHDSANLVHGDLKMDNVLLKVGRGGGGGGQLPAKGCLLGRRRSCFAPPAYEARS